VGTDGAASSNSLNPLEQVRLFGLLGKHFSQDATQFNCKSLWKILMAGHGALPFNTGKMKAGTEADLVFWDLASPGVMPVHNPLAAILYSSSNQQVRHVMVGGQWVKFDGWVKMDEKAVRQELMEKSQHMMKLGKGKTPLQF
jgi:5-methylthioadenosine/S-adenosylhomocysteine deaminase